MMEEMQAIAEQSAIKIPVCNSKVKLRFDKLWAISRSPRNMRLMKSYKEENIVKEAGQHQYNCLLTAWTEGFRSLSLDEHNFRDNCYSINITTGHAVLTFRTSSAGQYVI